VGALDGHAAPADGGPVRHEETVILPRGVYSLKAAAVAAGGRQLAIEQPLNAELVHGVGFDASDLLLLESSGGKRRLTADGSIASDTMALYLEIYVREQLPTQAVGVTVEIVDAGGRRRASMMLPVKEDSGKALLYAEGVVDLAAMPPGRYVARAFVLSGLRVARTIERSFDLTARRRPVEPALKP
jgi:hypothetical protein